MLPEPARPPEPPELFEPAIAALIEAALELRAACEFKAEEEDEAPELLFEF